MVGGERCRCLFVSETLSATGSQGSAPFISGTVVKRTSVTYYRVQIAAMMYKLWKWLSSGRKIRFVFGKDDFLLWRRPAPLTHVTISSQRRSHPLGFNSHARLVGTTQLSSPQGVLQSIVIPRVIGGVIHHHRL